MAKTFRCSGFTAITRKRLRICHRCNSFYYGTKFSKICDDCCKKSGPKRNGNVNINMGLEVPLNAN